MMVKVKAFAALREELGFSELRMEVAPGSDVATLLTQLSARAAGIDLAQRRFSVAINRTFAGREQVLNDGDEVALIPPVSGGAGRFFEMTEGKISLDDIAGRLVAPDLGGITVFAGTVRGLTGEVQTDYLEYEAYPEMAEASFASIADEARERWPEIAAVAVVHRVGRLEVGDISIAIAVAAAHRRDTFDACHYIIDRIKQVSPIWKKEVSPGGAMWVEGPESTV